MNGDTVTPLTLQHIAASVPPGSSWAAYHAAARRLDAIPAETVPQQLRARVAMLGSFTLDPFMPVLRIEAARSGLWMDTYLAPYGQYLCELLDPGSGLYRFRPHVTFLAIDSDVLWNQRWAENPPLRSEPVVGELLSPLFSGLDVFDQAGHGIVVVNDFVLPRRSTEGVNAFRSKATFAHTVAHANKHLRLRLATRDHTFLFPMADVVAQVGRNQSFNWRSHYRGHVTWSDALMGAVAERYVGFALASLGKATKCIVLDLDNTLWGGVLGEDGAGGVALGPQWPGSEFLDFQRELLDLQRQGILLAVCSKNNESEALAVLRSHPHMLVREEVLAAYRINWEDKATNIRALAKELNIGLDHMLLIDDSPHERAWVREMIPELQVPEVPPDPSLYATWVGSLPSLIVLQQTAEDSRRTEQYRESRVREVYRSTASSLEDFLGGLGLRAEVGLVTDETMARAVQLLAKTNQFNLTTRRLTEGAVSALASEPGVCTRTVRLADRFGDHGLVSVLIATRAEDVVEIDDWLMSCRVLKRGVEKMLLGELVDWAVAHGARELRGRFVPTGRNELVRGLFDELGFERSSESESETHYRLSLDGFTQPAHFIEVEREASAYA
jgi:FkbH-like protein